MTQAPVSKPTLVKSWDEKRCRMVILLKNGDAPLRDVTVEDTYPSAIAGVLCFAKVGGIAPMAMASEGKISWKVANLRPGEVKELVYTALTRETLRDPGVARKPLATDAALLASMVGVMPGLMIGAAPTAKTTSSEVHMVPPVTQVPPEMKNEKPEIVIGDALAKEVASPGVPIETQAAVIPPETKTISPGIKTEKHGIVVAVGAGKGGTGKTTFSINLGVALSENGFRTVLMDADASMSNLSTYIGMDPGKMQATLHDVLAGEAEPEKAIYKVFNERLRVVPSGLSIEGFLKMDRELLKDAIEYFSSDADFIIIDTPAGYNKEVMLSLLASDHLILVLNPDEGSMTDGLKMQEMAGILGVNVLGIVLNRYDMKCPQFSKAQIEEHFGTPVIAMLPDDPNVRRRDKVPVVLASPASRVSVETYRVADIISGHRQSQSPSFVSRLMDALFRDP